MSNIGVIPVAGRGLRLLPYTENTPKALFEIGGQTLLDRNLDILVNKLHLRKIYIIHGHLGQQILDTLASRHRPGVDIEYLECSDPSVGLAHGLLLLKEKIHEPFTVILGDELYLDSNHESLLPYYSRPIDAVCGYLDTRDEAQIRQNYALDIRDERIARLEEKPTAITNNRLGCGTFIFSPIIFEYIAKTSASSRYGKVELIDAINLLAQERGQVFAAQLQANYCNINYARDYIRATHLYRKRHHGEYKTSLVIPAYNEEASLQHVLREFAGHVDEIVVAAHAGSTDKTIEIAKNGAHVTLVRHFRGYGDALRQGMDAATGDILILVEADGSFSADDLPKLLSYLEDADMVIGTRTTKQMILQGANMSTVLRWGNLLAAKFMQLFWFSWENRFTDLGCTYRVLWRECYNIIRSDLHEDGPAFSPEMMVEVIRIKRKLIEIPVTYRPRLGGVSKHSGSWPHIIRTALSMLGMIIRKRIHYALQSVR